MKMTQALKGWLSENKDLSADASDDESIKAAAESLVDGTLTGENYTELTADPDAEKATKLESQLDKILDAISDQGKRIQAIEEKPVENLKDQIQEAVEKVQPKEEVKIAASAPEMPSQGIGEAIAKGEAVSTDTESSVNVIPAHKQYDTTHKDLMFPKYNQGGAIHPFGGQRAFVADGSARRPMEESSELDKAVSGAWFKYMLKSSGAGQKCGALRMTEHDKGLLDYAMSEMKWAGMLRGEYVSDGAALVDNRKLTPIEQKQLLDDGTSDGLEIAPIVFDDDIIRTPTLFGQFFPRVNVVNISRGRRIEGAVFPNVTVNSAGQGEGTNIALETTASFITAFDTTIFVADGAIEVGLDFLSDSPVNVGAIIVEEYGKALMAWLDNQIINGDGTTEPEGVVNDAGIGTAASANGAGGPHVVGDYEAMLLGIPFRMRQGFDSNRIAFFGNETNYRRARSIAVGAADQRRVFGMDHESYSLLRHPYGLEANVGNATGGCVNFGRYRMYRRAGMTVRQTTEGRTLTRSNFLLISMRARFGGALEDGAAGILVTDLQT